MNPKKTFTFAIMDAPFESARTTTAFRIMDAALRRGHAVNVFAYEGAVALTFARQQGHPNPVHGHDAEEENHPLPKDQFLALRELARANDTELSWVNCGLCVNERGVDEAVDGVTNGGVPALWKFAESSANSLVIPTRG